MPSTTLPRPGTSPRSGHARTAARTRGVRAAASLPLAVLLAVPAAALTASSASAAPLHDAVTGAAWFLQEQLRAGGDHLSTTYGGVDYPDHGLTADAVIALSASGTAQDAAAAATDWLAANLGAYIGTGGELYAGSAAKALNVALIQGRDATAFGGVNLVQSVVSTVDANGRVVDTSQWGNYSNTFGQAFAVVGLTRVGSDPAAATAAASAASFLAAQQCPGGGYQLSTNAACTDDAQADTDATALAAQALIASGHPQQAAAALDFLAARQSTDGSVSGTGPTATPNANTTGLAGQAFLAGGRVAQARLAQAYVAGLQLGCDTPAAVQGGIAYDPAGRAAVVESGTADDQTRRATAQAILALAGTPLATVTATGAADLAPAPACSTTSVPTGTATTTTATTTGTATATGTATSSTATSGTSTASGTATGTATGTSTQTGPVPTTSASAPGGSSSTTAGSGSDGGSDGDGPEGSGQGWNGPGGTGSGPTHGPRGSLADTGTDLAWPLGVGSALVAGGAALLLAARRRSTGPQA